MKIRQIRKTINRREKETPCITAIDKLLWVDMLEFHATVRAKIKELRK